MCALGFIFRYQKSILQYPRKSVSRRVWTLLVSARLSAGLPSDRPKVGIPQPDLVPDFLPDFHLTDSKSYISQSELVPDFLPDFQISLKMITSKVMVVNLWIPLYISLEPLC